MMMTMRGLVLVFVAGCLQSHGGTEVTSEQCATCHIQEYDSTTTPVHRDQGFDTTCGDCHRNAGPPGCAGPDCWRPALEGKHGAIFLLQTPHANIKCMQCHNPDAGPSKGGANTDCIGCHHDSKTQADSHAGATSDTGVAYGSYKSDVYNFCYSCHPSGKIAPHPDSKFPRSGGHDVYCVQCHKKTLGVKNDINNSDCVTCHPRQAGGGGEGHSGSQYISARGTSPPMPPANMHFCLTCHRGGGGGDD
jgi:hypothetical protein